MVANTNGHSYNENNWCVKCERCNVTIKTLHCPGTPIDNQTFNDIFCGVLDYRFGVWVKASPYVSTFAPEDNLRNEKLLTTLLLKLNKVIPIEAYKYQKALIASYGNLITSN